MSGREGRGAAPSFRFRPATEADFEALLDLSIRTMRDHLERIGRYDPARRRSVARAAFETGALRVIEMDGAMAGCIGVLRHPDHVEINGFFLEPALQGRGLGSAILRAVLAECEGQPVRLQVLKQSPAIRFYERLGFIRTGEKPFDWTYELRA
ncbi:MAG TPA: GNAT family N-acetyltransferase [Roseomonas sp.]|nr:GNAT family N-acetyltransferase [Roseomonas sp.]